LRDSYTAFPLRFKRPDVRKAWKLLSP
jgi:hypothetical protein